MAVTINLHPGSFSTALSDGGMENFAIAFDVDIENAIGGAFDDVLHGNALNNQLTGGAGSDLFCFSPQWGIDEITDFTPGEDILDFSQTGLQFNDLIIESDIHSLTIRYGDDEIRLLGVESLSESAFLF